MVRNALGTVEQTAGQHQGRCLIDAQPVPFHEQHPAHHELEKAGFTSTTSTPSR